MNNNNNKLTILIAILEPKYNQKIIRKKKNSDNK